MNTDNPSKKTKTYRVTIDITHDVDKYNALVEEFVADMHPELRKMQAALPRRDDYPLNGSISSVLGLIAEASGHTEIESADATFNVPLLIPGTTFELPAMHELAGVKATIEEIES